MIRMIQSQSAAHAKDYFTSALAKPDYYLNDQELEGRFEGKLSKRLGIDGAVTRDVFFALCENRHPETGKPLTPRTKKDRTVGYDINFHVPKSVSILHALSQDDHILKVFQDSVGQTMRDIEADAKTRVRTGGKYADRETGELAYAEFIHQTARPTEDNTPDPHLHAHCYVFNVTWDEAEGRMKAGQFRDINRDMPYYEALFHKRLSDNLIKAGYAIRPTAKSFEVDGVPQNVIGMFSKRTDEIGRIAQEKGITDAKELDGLGARTRSKKQSGFSMAELRTDWRRQIKELDADKAKSGDQPVRFAPARGKALAQKNLERDACIDYAVLHCFERASVVPLRKLAQRAVKHSIGSSLTIDTVMQGLQEDKRLIRIKEKGVERCTTKEVLREEQSMVDLAQSGKGKLMPLYGDAPEIKATGQQAAALTHILTTPDRVSIVRGAAGAGKTTLMREAREHFENAGKQMVTVAPTAKAARGVLRDEGFKQAETVAFLLQSEVMQNALEGQVLWVDEAGMLGTRDMRDILALATQKNARVILGGDTRQHASVVRGDALRILNTVGGIPVAEVDKIYRQKDAVYRQAVADLSKGNIKAGFDKLDGIGAIRQVSRNKPYGSLVDEYIAAVKAGKYALVISPTHDVGDKAAAEIRRALKAQKMLGKKEINARRLKNLNLTEAEKTDWRNYKEGQFVQFNQHAKGIKRGSQWRVDQTSAEAITIKNKEGATLPLPLKKAKDFDVYQEKELALSKGDKVQITKNGWDKNKERLNNGQVFDVLSVSTKGNIVLGSGDGKTRHTIDREFGHITHAHCITSHASQGKTVDCVFVAQPAATFEASNARQFYVSVSRARETVAIFTDDKERLLEEVSVVGDRKSAMELVGKSSHEVHIQQRQNEPLKQPENVKDQYIVAESQPTPHPSHKHEDYEPGF